MAESVFRARIEEAGLDGLVEVDSAGTGGWHEADGAHCTVAVLEAAGYESGDAARQFHVSWFSGLDLVIALDSGHLKALRRLAPTPEDATRSGCARGSGPPTRVTTWTFPILYYGPMDGFEECLEMVEAASPGLLAAVRQELEGRAA